MHGKSKVWLGVLLGLMALSTWAQKADATLPRWRGFNLLGMFSKNWSPGDFNEEDFSLIREWGFNFVRLPLDYRFWLKDEAQWDEIDEERLAPIDRAVAWGQRHQVHVMLCLHRAPGYTVAKPAEKLDLFSDAEALKVCVQHWRLLAERYRTVPSSALSFNLFNEPSDKVAPADMVRVVSALVSAIREVTPTRLIMVDGLNWGTKPIPHLFELGVGQATRGYNPMNVSHYKADWVTLPPLEPAWPPVVRACSPLYGPFKKPWDVPLVIEDVPAGTLSLWPDVVSGKVTLYAQVDGKKVWEQVLEPSVSDTEHWTNAVHHSAWQVVQARARQALKVDLPQGARRLEVGVSAGDWCGMRELSLQTAHEAQGRLAFAPEWGKTNVHFRFRADMAQAGGFVPAAGVEGGLEFLRRTVLEPWRVAQAANVFVMVGEFGAFNQTPHDITLRWLEDNLRVWQEVGWGWALWNFDGSFGIINSKRADVEYEDFRGRKLDRKMLELLQRY